MSAFFDKDASKGDLLEMRPFEPKSEPTQKDSNKPLEIYETYLQPQQLQFAHLIECLNTKHESKLDFSERFKTLISYLEESSKFFLEALSSGKINVSDIEEALRESELKKRRDSFLDFSTLFSEELEKNEWLSQAKNFLNLLFLNPELFDFEVLNRMQPLIKVLAYFDESDPNIKPLVEKFEIIKIIKNEERLFSNLRDVLDPKSNEAPSMSAKELIKELKKSNRIFLRALKSGKINIADILKALTKEELKEESGFFSQIWNRSESPENQKSNEFAIYREWVAGAVRFLDLLLSKPEIFYLELKVLVNGIQLYQDKISNSIQPLVEILYYFNKLDPSVKPLIVKFELIKKIKQKEHYDLFLNNYEKSFGAAIQYQIFSDLDQPMSRSVSSIMDTLFESYVGLSDSSPLSLLEQARDAAWLLLKLKQLDKRGREEGFEQYIHKLTHTYFSRMNNYKGDLFRHHSKQYGSLYEPIESEVSQKIKEINREIEQNLGKKQEREVHSGNVEENKSKVASQSAEKFELADEEHLEKTQRNSDEEKQKKAMKPGERVRSSLEVASKVIDGTQFFDVELNETQNEAQNEARETKRDDTKSFENMTDFLEEKQERIEGEKRVGSGVEKQPGEVKVVSGESLGNASGKFNEEERGKIAGAKSRGIVQRRLASPSEVANGIRWSYVELNETENKDKETKPEGCASFIFQTLFGWLDTAKQKAEKYPKATAAITLGSFLLIGAGICVVTGGAGLPVLAFVSAIYIKITLAGVVTAGGVGVTQAACSACCFFLKHKSDSAGRGIEAHSSGAPLSCDLPGDSSKQLRIQ